MSASDVSQNENIENATTFVSILIVNWNGKQYLDACFRSIQEKVSVPYEVIVVDNASTDGSADEIQERHPWVKLIRSADNFGFAAGNNLAAQHASGKYFLLLNNDTELQTDIADAVSALESDAKIGAVGAAMYGRYGELRKNAMCFPTPMRLCFFRSMWVKRPKVWPSPAGIELNRVDTIEGSFLMTRAEAWRHLNGMDERNYMYVDDVEYCRNLLTLGLIVVRSPQIRYTHFGGYNHARMGYLFSGYRRYFRKFATRREQVAADYVLRFGLSLRLPWYWLRAVVKRDAVSWQAFTHAADLKRNWDKTLVDGYRFQ